MERESTEEDTVIYHCLRLSNDWTGDPSLAIAASRWIKPFSNRGHFWSRKYILILTDFWSQFVRSFKMSMELGNLQPVLRKFDHLFFINIKVYTDTIIVYYKQYELTLCWTGSDYWKHWTKWSNGVFNWENRSCRVRLKLWESSFVICLNKLDSVHRVGDNIKQNCHVPFHASLHHPNATTSPPSSI